MKEMIEKIFLCIENSKFYYKIFYLFVSLSFVTILKIIPHIDLLSKVALVWGLIISIYTVFSAYRKRKLYTFDIYIQIFLAITLIFTLLFYRNIENIKYWIINAIIFLSFYTVDIFKNKKILIGQVDIISSLYCGFMCIASSVSVIMKITNSIIKSGLYVFEGNKGGLFENKNALCIAAAIALALCVYLYYRDRSHKMKCYYVFNAVVQLIVLCTFRGRSAILIIAGILFTALFVYSSNKYIRSLMIIIPVLIICVLCTYINFETIRVFTTGRVNLWLSAFAVIKKHPFIGVGGSAMVESIYNVKITSDLPGLEFGGLHNIYIQIATVNGLISITFFIAFILGLLIFLINKICELKRSEKARMTILFSMLVGILAVNLFESSLIYIISYISIIFWVYCGYLISILDNKNFS